MAINVKIRCSECNFTRQDRLNPDDKELTCPVCGRRLQNLTAEECQEIETALTKQRNFSIMAIVLFAMAVVCLLVWMGDPAGWTCKLDGATGSVTPPQDANAGLFIGAIVFGIASAVLSGFASAKRFVVEF